MATVTVTLQASLDQPRSNPNGGSVVVKAFNGMPGAQSIGTAGDVVLLAKLPNQANVLDILGYVQCASTSLQGIVAVAEVLAGGTLSFRATLCSLSVVTAGGPIKTGIGVNPHKVSISDDAAVQYAMLAVKFSGGSASTSFSINGAVLYDTSGD
jgi:hypothetical protein